MAKFKIKNKNVNICQNFKIASGFFDRLIGLMFKGDMANYDGLLIKKCNSIHTFFMFFAIDVVFMDSSYKVVRIIRNMKPWRVTRMYFKASQVLELKAGALNDQLQLGDRLEVVCIN